MRYASLALVLLCLTAGLALGQPAPAPPPPGPPPTAAHEWKYLGNVGGSFGGYGWGLKGVAAPACPCGVGCACPAGVCPTGCPVRAAPNASAGQYLAYPQFQTGGCAGGSCANGQCSPAPRGFFFRR